MTTRQRNGAILLAIFALAGFLFVESGALAPARRAPTVLSAVPERAFLVTTLNVPALRASPLADALAPLLGALDSESAKKACGFDPFDRVYTAAVALPEESTGDFGVVLRGPSTRDELVDCAKKTIASRGGSAETRPDPRHPTFVRVKDSSVAAATSPELVFGDDGLVLLGRGAWLEAMLASATGEAKSVLDGGMHMDLRRALGGSDGSSNDPRSALLTVVLPHALREHLKDDMAEDGGVSESMSGVFAVEAAGVALTAGDAGGTTELAAEARCETASACDAVDALLAKKRAAWSKELTLRFLGLGPVLDGLTVDKRGTTLSAHVAIPAEDAGRIAAKLVAVRRGGISAPASPPPTSSGGAPFPPLPTPDEVVRPRR